MPKFLTYQRPAAVTQRNLGGKPGTAYGKPVKKAPTAAPKHPQRALDIKLPGATVPKPH